MRTRMSQGSSWPTASGIRAKKRRRRLPRPCSEPKRMPRAMPTRTVSRIDAVTTRRRRRSSTTSCTLRPTIAGTALSMFTTSFVHCAPRKPPIAMTGTASERIAGHPPALVVGRAVAAAEIARRRRGDPHDAGLGVVRGDDRQHAHARRAGEQPRRGVDPVEAVLHDHHRHAVDQGGVRRDGRLGVLRLRAHEHELGHDRERLGRGDVRVRLAVAAGQPDAARADRLEAGAARRHLHVVSRAREQRGEGAAERARADDADPHAPSVEARRAAVGRRRGRADPARLLACTA